MYKIFTFVVSALVCGNATSIAAPAQSCWEVLRNVSPGFPSDSACVLNTANAQLEGLCTQNGISPDKPFLVYLKYRSLYKQAQAEADKWVSENPGKNKYPGQISANLQNAEIAWIGPGKRYHIDQQIEDLLHASSSCK